MTTTERAPARTESPAGRPKDSTRHVVDNQSLTDGDARARRWQLAVLALALLSQTTLAWAVSLFQSGRVPPTAISTASVALTPLGHRIDDYVRYVVLAVVVLIILINITKFKRRRPGSLIVALLGVAMLWASMAIATGRLDAGATHSFLLLVIAVAAWSIGLNVEDLVVLARIGVVIAIVCLLMGLTTDLAWTDQDEDSKALVGSAVLAGFFPQMNPFGMSMAMTLPFTLLFKRTSIRIVGLLLICTALLFASSRTALIGAGIGLAIGLVLHLARGRARGLIGWTALLTISLASVLVPMMSDDAAFTRRGAVWQAAIHLFPISPLWGYGPGAFGLSGPISKVVSGAYWHGHNTILTFAVVGGLCALIALAVFTIAAFRRAMQLGKVSVVPAVAVLTLVAIGIAEAPIRPDEFDGVGWVSWLALFSIASLKRSEEGVKATVQDSARFDSPTSPRRR